MTYVVHAKNHRKTLDAAGVVSGKSTHINHPSFVVHAEWAGCALHTPPDLDESLHHALIEALVNIGITNVNQNTFTSFTLQAAGRRCHSYWWLG
jgi:hypothetical protein